MRPIEDAWSHGTGRRDRHRGKLLQPQNRPPAFAPDLAVRRIIFEPHLGQLGFESVEGVVASGGFTGVVLVALGSPKNAMICASSSLGA